MSQVVASRRDPYVSPRHGFTFTEVPTVRGSTYGGSCVFHYPDSYGAILDSTFEMADAVASANGIAAAAAMDQVLKDEGWRLLPKHRKVIEARLA